ncbi:MAG TPA: AAA family ATPase [Terriglobia bacterium]|nr:AAA family ATPase [Terriglobia bacterium]
MRFLQISLRGISEAFRDRVSVDFEALGSGLIAIVGENGAGKSTLIGSMFAALFRQLPGQKRSLYDFCTHPEPQIDLTFSLNGERYQSLLKLEPKSRQMESYIFDCKGVALASGKKEAFHEWIGRRVGTSGFYLASIFSSQRRTGNFLGLERRQRKELFITQLLGLERLRLISVTARAFAEEVGRKVLALEGESKGVTQVLASASEVENIEKLTGEIETATTKLSELEEEKNALEREARDLHARESECKAVQSQAQELSRRIAKTNGEIAQVRKLIAEDDRMLEGRAGVDGFAERERTLMDRIQDLHRQIGETQNLEASNREVELALRTVETDLNTKRNDLDRSQVESGELATVPCGGRGPYAGCVKIQRAIIAQRQLPILAGAVATLELEVDLQRCSLLPNSIGSAQLLKSLDGCESERRELDAVRTRQEALRIIEARRKERAATVERLGLDRTELEGQQEAQVQKLNQFGGIASELEGVSKRMGAVSSSVASVRAERERLIVRRVQMEQRRQQIEVARSRAAVLEVELAEARGNREDFEYLAKAFGPDEIQLCEIQSAGPGVSSIVNALLEGCFDNKFEVHFRTKRERADGRGFVDDFDIEVRNKALDRTCLVDELSGGQFVLVNEAVNLAIAIHNMRQSDSVRHETLFRDETVGALDTKNAKEYIRMLRHAMELGGFHQVIFICHAPQVWEMADRVLRVHNGQVLIESGVNA